jgi:hypothetical protein
MIVSRIGFHPYKKDDPRKTTNKEVELKSWARQLKVRHMNCAHLRFATAAKTTGFQVDLLHRIGDVHHAIVTRAMGQTARVTKLMIGLFLTTRIEELRVARQPIKLWAQTVQRNHRNLTAQLRLTKYKR